MKLIFAFSIVCFSFLTGFSQAPLTVSEAEARGNLFYSFNADVEARAWTILEDTARWKDWEVVENYSFGKNRGSLPMIADLGSLHPYFRDKVIELVKACEAKGIKLAIVETYRTHTKQREYKSMGRRYTRSVAGRSKHQYGLAVDVVPMNDTVAVWNNYALWRKVGLIGERLGLRWGGRWRNPYDPGHFEWTGGIGTYHLAQGNFPPLPKNAQYPCLEEDLRELQRHWRAWEVEQAAIAMKEPLRVGMRQPKNRPVPGGE